MAVSAAWVARRFLEGFTIFINVKVLCDCLGRLCTSRTRFVRSLVYVRMKRLHGDCVDRVATRNAWRWECPKKVLGLLHNHCNFSVFFIKLRNLSMQALNRQELTGTYLFTYFFTYLCKTCLLIEQFNVFLIFDNCLYKMIVFL